MIENHYKIVSFDMDGTLIPNTTTTLHYAELLGVRREVETLEIEFKNGLLDSTGFMHKISQIMVGLSLSFIKENLNTLPVINGIEETIKKLKENGVVTVIVTTSAKEKGVKAGYGATQKGVKAGYGATQTEITNRKILINALHHNRL